MSAPPCLALGCAPDGFTPLLPDDGEYARSVAARGALAPAARIELFAWELVERVRDGHERGERRWCAPVWPAALWDALGIPSHPWPELAPLLPAPLHVSSHAPGEAEVVAECARLGLAVQHPAAYLYALARRATEERWAQRFFAPGGFAGQPEARTAAGILVRDGRVLLERRPPDARVTPGAWDVPGGHVEEREDPARALERELEEELGVRVRDASFACELDALEPPHGRRYRHALFVVRHFEGEPRAREGQHLAWFTPIEALALETLSPPTGWALQEAFEAGSLAP